MCDAARVLLSRRRSFRAFTAVVGIAWGAALTTSPGCDQDTCAPEDYLDRVELELVASPTTARLRAVVGRADGGAIAVGDGGTIVAISAGAAAQARDSGVTDDLYGVAYPPSPVGVVVAVGAGGAIVRSEDSGASWGPVVSGVMVDLRGVAFASSVGIAVGDGVVLRSEDAGVTWSAVTLPGPAGSLRAIANGWHAEANRYEQLAVGDGGAAWFSTTRGSEWAAVEVGSQVDLRSVGTVDSFRGWNFAVLTAAGEVLRVNGGVVSVSASAVAGSELRGLSRQDGWLVGGDGSVRTWASNEWTPPSFAAGADGRAIALDAIDSVEQEALAVGEGGAIVRAVRGPPLCSWMPMGCY
jgi:hypothetical protein